MTAREEFEAIMTRLQWGGDGVTTADVAALKRLYPFEPVTRATKFCLRCGRKFQTRTVSKKLCQPCSKASECVFIPKSYK